MTSKKRETTYQRLKEKVERLQYQLTTVCLYPNSSEATVIKAYIKTMHDIEKQIWSGGFDNQKNNYNGLLSQVSRK